MLSRSLTSKRSPMASTSTMIGRDFIYQWESSMRSPSCPSPSPPPHSPDCGAHTPLAVEEEDIPDVGKDSVIGLQVFLRDVSIRHTAPPLSRFGLVALIISKSTIGPHQRADRLSRKELSSSEAPTRAKANPRRAASPTGVDSAATVPRY